MLQQQPVTLNTKSTTPVWMIWCIAGFYLALIGFAVLLPGGTLLERLRWLVSGICAQIPSHSLYPGGERLPLCSRNTGIYLGFIVTLITLYASRRGRAQRTPPWPIIVVVVTGVLFLAVDGLNSLALDLRLPHLYQPHNLLRLTSGLLTGFAMATLVLPILNQLFWHQYNQQRSIASWTSYLLLLPGLLFSFIACASQSIIILYPVALLSTAGLVTVAASLNIIAILALCRKQETLVYYRDLLPYFALAVVFALGELLILAQGKVWLLHVLGI